MSEREQKALRLFDGGFNCAQSVVGAFCEDYGIELRTALRLCGGMGGGFRCGEICGAAAGATAVVGLQHGQITPGDTEAKALCGERTIEFMTSFDKEFGALTCRDLLGCDTSTPEGKEQAQQQNLHQTVCTGLVTGAARLLEELGY